MCGTPAVPEKNSLGLVSPFGSLMIQGMVYGFVLHVREQFLALLMLSVTIKCFLSP